MENIIFEVVGGICKNIVATAVVRAIKKQYPNKNIILQTAYPEVFINNPNIYRIYRYGNMPYFYDNHIKGHDVTFMCNEPYKTDGYLLGTDPLSKSWCDVHNVQWDGSKPDIYLTPLELQRVSTKISPHKPLLLIQPFSGFSTEIKYSWNRDIPPMQMFEIASTLSNKYQILQIGRPDQIQVPNTTLFHSNDIRELLSLVTISNARLCVDSFIQHAAAAFNMPSVVCWITDNPLVTGYDLHTNVHPAADMSAQTTIDGGYQLYDFNGGKIFDYPFSHTNIFNINEILSKF